MTTATKKTAKTSSAIDSLAALEAARDSAAQKLRELRREHSGKQRLAQELFARREQRKRRAPGEYHEDGVTPLDEDSEAGQIQQAIESLGEIDLSARIAHRENLLRGTQLDVAAHIAANREALFEGLVPRAHAAVQLWQEWASGGMPAYSALNEVASLAITYGADPQELPLLDDWSAISQRVGEMGAPPLPLPRSLVAELQEEQGNE